MPTLLGLSEEAIAEGVVRVGASFIPGGGELQDAEVMATSDSPVAVGLATGSLILSVVTAGFAPNYGAGARSVDAVSNAAASPGRQVTTAELTAGNDLVSHLDDDVFLHYTDDVGLSGIVSDGAIRANARNRVYLTQEMYQPDEAMRALFMNAPTHVGRGDNVLMFRIRDRSRLAAGHQPNELIHSGSIRLEDVDLLYHGRNPF